jgi:hypothetical protein
MRTVDDAMELLFAPEDQASVDTREIDDAVAVRIQQWHQIWRESIKDRPRDQELRDGE